MCARDLDAVEVLLEEGVSTNTTTERKTALSCTLENEDMKIAGLLLEHGAKLPDQSVVGRVLGKYSTTIGDGSYAGEHVLKADKNRRRR